jgi:hypothetical protein
MPTLVLTAATEEAANHRELPFPAELYGIVAMAVFIGLFAFTWAFRNVAHNH